MFKSELVNTILDDATGDFCLEYEGRYFLSLVKNTKCILIRKAGLKGIELLGLLNYLTWFLKEILLIENCAYINIHKDDFNLLEDKPSSDEATMFFINDQYCFLKNATFSSYQFTRIFNFKNL